MVIRLLLIVMRMVITSIGRRLMYSEECQDETVISLEQTGNFMMTEELRIGAHVPPDLI